MSHDATSFRPILKGFTYLIGHLLCNLAYFDGAWWLNCRFGTLRPEGSRFEFHSSRHVASPRPVESQYGAREEIDDD